MRDVWTKFEICALKNVCFIDTQKICSRFAPPRCRHTWTRRAKFWITLTHSSLGIALILAVIAALRSGIVCVHIVLQIAPKVKVWGVQVWRVWSPLWVRVCSADEHIWNISLSVNKTNIFQGTDFKLRLNVTHRLKIMWLKLGAGTKTITEVIHVFNMLVSFFMSGSSVSAARRSTSGTYLWASMKQTYFKAEISNFVQTSRIDSNLCY